MENDFGEGAFLDYFLQQRRHVGAQEHPKSFRIRKVIIINVIIINVFLLGGVGVGVVYYRLLVAFRERQL